MTITLDQAAASAARKVGARQRRAAADRARSRRAPATAPATIDPLAYDRCDRIVKRAMRGETSPAVAQRQIEAYAAALPVTIYDAAIDQILAAAAAHGGDLATVEWSGAADRPDKIDGTDAQTRRARRREQRRHQAAAHKGEASGVESNVARKVTAARNWRGETGPIALHHQRGTCDCNAANGNEHADHCAAHRIETVPGPAPVTVTRIVWAPRGWAEHVPAGVFPTVKRRIPERRVIADGESLDERVAIDGQHRAVLAGAKVPATFRDVAKRDRRIPAVPAVVAAARVVGGETIHGHRVNQFGQVDTGMRVRPAHQVTEEEQRNAAAAAHRRQILAELEADALAASSVPLAH